MRAYRYVHYVSGMQDEREPKGEILPGDLVRYEDPATGNPALGLVPAPTGEAPPPEGTVRLIGPAGRPVDLPASGAVPEMPLADLPFFIATARRLFDWLDATAARISTEEAAKKS